MSRCSIYPLGMLPTPSPMPVCQHCRIAMVLDRITPCAAEYDMWSYTCAECSGVFSMVGPQTADRASVDERRSVPRHAVTTPARIESGRRAFHCTVGNISATGARVNLAGRPPLPKKLKLMASGATLPCRAVWRRGTQIGIEFD